MFGFGGDKERRNANDVKCAFYIIILYIIDAVSMSYLFVFRALGTSTM